MRKLLTFLKTLIAALAVIVLFTACKQLLDDPEDFLSYWASEAFVKDHSIGSEPRPDGAGVPCVSSSVDVLPIMLTVHNPKNFPLVMPSSSEPAGIVEFKELSPQPTLGTHYDLERTASGRLKLTYKKAFLQKYEQGSGSLNPTITLKATDGRVFKKTYTFGIKSNTPPPKPAVVLAKTKIDALNPASYYVLCLKFDSAEMINTVAMNSGSAPVHKDIAKITINDSHYTLLYKDNNSDFKKPDGDSFVERGNVEKLNPSSPDVPSGAWVLYYKTNIKIRAGNNFTSYTITLSDEGGVVSDVAVAEIEESGPTHTVTFSVENGQGGSLKGEYGSTNQIASGSTSGNLTVPRERNVTFTAIPAEGWEVDSWEVSPGSFESGGGIGTSAALRVTGNTTVTVKFKKTTYKVTFMVDGANGTLTAKVDGTEIHSGDDVEKGKTVSFTATPEYGWEVKAWTLDGNAVNGTNSSYSFPVTKAAEVKVSFENTPPDVGSFEDTGDGFIKITPPAKGIVGVDPDYTLPGNEDKWKGVFPVGRKVKLSPYKLGKTEVTYKLWKEVYDWAVKAENGYKFANAGVKGSSGSGTDDEPVTTISWRDCIVWCNAYTEKEKGIDACVYRNKDNHDLVLKDATAEAACDAAYADMSKKGFRLPTEAEWEYAARWQGSNTTNAAQYGEVWLTKLNSASGAKDKWDTAETGEVAWYDGNSGSKTHPVGKKQENALKLHDMSGNVWEWCFDWYGDIEANTVTDPQGGASGTRRVSRGGSWYFGARYCTVGVRDYVSPDDRLSNLGFRLACRP